MNATPGPTIYDLANLQQIQSGLSPLVQQAAREAEFRQQQALHQQALQEEANRVFMAHRLRRELAQEDSTRDAAARMAAQEAEFTFRGKAAKADQDFRRTEGEADRKATNERAIQMGKDYFDRISEKEKQELLSDYARRGYTPKAGEDPSTFVARVALEEAQVGTERIGKLRNARGSMEQEYFGLAGEIEAEWNKAADQAALSAVRSSGVLKPAQIQNLDKLGFPTFISNLRQSDPQKAADLESSYLAKREEVAAKITPPVQKTARLQLLRSDIEDVDTSMRDLMKANKSYDPSEFYGSQSQGAAVFGQPASGKPLSGLSSFASGLNQKHSATSQPQTQASSGPVATQAPPEIAALSAQYKAKLNGMSPLQMDAFSQGINEAIGRKYGFPTESPYNTIGSSNVRNPFMGTEESILAKHPELWNQIQDDPAAVKQIYDSALIKATRTPGSWEQGNYNLTPYRPR